MAENIAEITEDNYDNISKVAKVEVLLSVELGNAKIALRDAIEYDTGSIIKLDKLCDEPVNVFVDDILIAKGQIVAVEDSYGIKIVEIVENKTEEN